MTKLKPTPPADLWVQLDAALEELQSQPPEPRPPGVFTTLEYVETHPGVAVLSAARIINKLIISGRVEKTKIWQRNHNGSWTRRDAYRMKK
jgi:hypothetical protein